MLCFTFIIFSKAISLTCFDNFNKTDSEKMTYKYNVFNPLMPGSKKGHIYLNKAAGLFKYV